MADDTKQELSQFSSALRELSKVLASTRMSVDDTHKAFSALGKMFAEARKESGSVLGALSQIKTALFSTKEGAQILEVGIGNLAKSFMGGGMGVEVMTGLLGGLSAGAIAAGAAIAAAVVAVVALGAALIAGIYTGMQAVIGTMAQTEQQITKLHTSFQDLTKATIMYGKALKFAAETPTSMNEVIDSITQLQVFQFQSFDKVDKSGRQLIGMLGDMAGAMGTDLATATHALVRAQVGEWEIMQNNFQISARMIPELRGLSSGTKEYGDAIVAFLAKQGRFLGGMELQAKTIAGMLSNVKDAVDILKVGAAGVNDAQQTFAKFTFYDAVKDSVKRLYDVLSDKSAFQKSQQLMGMIADGADPKAIEAVRTSLEGTFKMVGANGDKFSRDFKKVFNDPSLKSDAEKMNAMIKMGYGGQELLSQNEKIMQMGQMIGQVFQTIWRVFIDPVFKAIGVGIDWLFQKSQQIMEMVTGPLERMTGKLDRVTKGMFEDLSDAALKTLGGTRANGLAILNAAGGDLKNLTKAMQKEIADNGLQTISGPMKALMVFKVIAGVLEIFLIALMERIIDAFSPLWSIMKDIGRLFMILVDAVIAFWKGFAQGAMVFDYLDPIKDALSSIAHAFHMLTDAIVGNSKTTMPIFKALGYVLGVVIGGGLRLVIGMFQILAKGIEVIIASVIFIQKAASFLFSEMVHGLPYVAKLMGDWLMSFEPIYKGVKWLGKAWDWIKGKIGEFFSFLKSNSDIDIFGSLKAKFDEAVAWVDAKTNGLATSVLDALSGIVQMIAAPFIGLKNMIGEALGVAGRLLSEFWEGIKNSDTVKGLTAIFGATLGTVKPIGSEKAGTQQTIPNQGKAVGDWNVPQNMMVTIHKGEMIIPSRDAERMRQLFEAGGSSFTNFAEGLAGAGAAPGSSGGVGATQELAVVVAGITVILKKMRGEFSDLVKSTGKAVKATEEHSQSLANIVIPKVAGERAPNTGAGSESSAENTVKETAKIPVPGDEKNKFSNDTYKGWTLYRSADNGYWLQQGTDTNSALNGAYDPATKVFTSSNGFKVKFPNGLSSAKQQGGYEITEVPGLAKGMSFVPYDNFMAMLHKGERVLTAREAQMAAAGNMGGAGHTINIELNLNGAGAVDAFTTLNVKNVAQQLAREVALGLG